jgi:GT2 family glycosyltransferase
MKFEQFNTADTPCVPVEAFRKPSTPVTSAWIEHTPFAFWLIKAASPSVFVELGTLHGVSYFTFCEAVQLLGKGTKCFAIDTWEGDDHTGLYGEDVWMHVQKLNRLYTPFSTLLRKTFDDALPSFEDGTIDLLHVDGRHFYDDVKHDFTSWIPKLSNSAIVIFHDINVHQKNFGVARYWSELKQQYPSFEFLHGNGLGVLAFGADIPHAARQLFGLQGAEASSVKIAYSRLGAAVSNELELAHEQAMVERLRKDIAHVQADSAHLNNELVQFRAAQSRADEITAVLKSERAAHDERSVQLQANIDELQRTLRTMESSSESDRSLRLDLETIQAEHHAAQQKIEELDKALATRDAVITSLRAEISQADEQAALLQARHEERLDRAKSQLQHVDHTVFEKRASEKQLEKKVQELKEKNELLEQEKTISEIRVANLQLNRKKLFSSRSWKFMSPFRTLGAVYRFARKSKKGAYERGALQRLREVIKAQKAVMALANTGAFDKEWYEDTYPDVAQTGIDPLVHYVYYGAAEKRRPTRLFDTAWYLETYPDVAATGMNPFQHYLLHGAAEGRNPSPDFDTSWYLSANQDVGESGVNPLLHYEKFGRAEKRLVKPPQSSSLKESVDGQIQAPGSANSFEFMPLISIITPVYNVASKWLRLAVRSVENQTYPNWELCLCNDGSTNPDTLEELARLEQRGGRIRVSTLPKNGGISAATNHALTQSSGAYVAFLDNDDELVANALEVYVEKLNFDRDIDVFYSDEAKLDENGVAEEPFYKPDWSPAMLREVMYVGHLLMARRELVERVGGPKSEFDGVQDFEFALRLSEQARKIVHVGKILYYWRRIPGSVAQNSEAKPDLTIKQAAAVNMHLRRMNIDAVAMPNPQHTHRLVVQPKPRTDWPRVSIVIPSKDAPHLISRCLDSIYGSTSYQNFEVIVVDNGSSDPDALKALAAHPIHKVDLPGTFNFSRANNRGVDVATGEYLILLNNDTEVIQSDWIEQMLFLLESSSVAAVGPMLLYPDQTIQHAGVALGLRGTADHVLRGLPRNADGYFGSLACTREVSAVTFACVMLRKSDYVAAHGLDELYQTHYQDVDLCLTLISDGRTILYTPRSVLIHHESATRGPKYDAIDRMLFLDRWGDDIAKGDPYSRWENEARQ